MKDQATTQRTFGQRAAAYWFADGLPHLVLGVALLLAGGLTLLWGISLPNPQLGQIVAVAAVAVLYCLYGRRVVDFLKSRLTYPRTGYVEPPEEEERITSTMTTLFESSAPPHKSSVSAFDRRVATILFSPLLMVTYNPPMEHWFIPVVMAVLAAALYALNRKTNPPCSWQSALVLALMGLVFLWVDVLPALQRVIPFFLASLWLLGQGAPKLIRHLSENQRAQIGGQA